MTDEENSGRSRTGSGSFNDMESEEIETRLISTDDERTNIDNDYINVAEYTNRLNRNGKRTYAYYLGYEEEVQDERQRLLSYFSTMYCLEGNSLGATYCVYVKAEVGLGSNCPRISSKWRFTSSFRSVFQRQIEYSKPRLLRLSCREAWQLTDDEVGKGNIKLLTQGGQDATYLWGTSCVFRGSKGCESSEDCSDGTLWFLPGRSGSRGTRLLHVKYEENNRISILLFKLFSEEVVEAYAVPTSIYWLEAGYTSCCRLVKYQFALCSTFQVSADVCSWSTELLEVIPYRLFAEVYDGISDAVSRGFLRFVL